MAVHFQAGTAVSGWGEEAVVSGRPLRFWVLVLGGLFATVAMADEIVFFTNGTSLPITDHRVEKDMVSVGLGANSRMGFPLYMVDRIESSGRSVYTNPVYRPANQAVGGTEHAGGTASMSYPVSGEGSVPSYRNKPRTNGPGGMPQEEFRTLGETPMGADGTAGGGRVNSAKSSMKALGNRASLPQGQFGNAEAGVGADQHFVIPASGDPGGGRRNLVRIQPRMNQGGAPSEPPPSSQEDPAQDPPSDTPPAQDAPPADPPSTE
jgi:hypothetical protein